MKTMSPDTLQSIRNENLTNETLRTIYSRRAVRKYTDQAVSKVTVQQIVDAGRMAPSAMNKQPLFFMFFPK